MNRRRPTGGGDPERIRAFDELYEATFTPVLAFCRRRTRSLGDAEDAAAETYLVAWRRLDAASSAEAPLLWLYAVAFRVIANQRRGRDRYRRLVERLGGYLGSGTTPAADTKILTAADAAEVVAALEILSSIDREIVRLVAYEQLTYAETGIVLGLSEAAVRTRLYRARRRLRDHLDGEIRRDDSTPPDTSIDEGPIRRSGGDRREEQP